MKLRFNDVAIFGCLKLPVKVAVALGCWSIGCAIAQARIGETEKQCEARYGKATASHDGDKSKWYYKKGDIIVLAHFNDGKCDYIMFMKIDGTAENKLEMSESEREVLLKANAGGREWEKSEGGVEMELWTKDGELSARYSTVGRTLVIATRESIGRTEAKKRAEEEKKLKGF